jgi:hypothetical protein
MVWPIDARLRVPENREIVAFLERCGPSAHGDIASELASACRPLSGIRLHCPDRARYAWVAAHDAGGRVLALAWGMGAISLRLEGGRRDPGLRPEPEIGPDWWTIEPFGLPDPLPTIRARLLALCRAAWEDLSRRGA